MFINVRINKVRKININIYPQMVTDIGGQISTVTTIPRPEGKKQGRKVVKESVEK